MRALKELRWHKISFTIKNIKQPGRGSAGPPLPLVIVNSIIKNVTSRFSRYPEERIFFHILGYRFPKPVKKNQSYTVEVLFFRKGEAFIEQWKESLIRYFENPEKRNFALESGVNIEIRTFSSFEKEIRSFSGAEEVCIDFLSPLPFTPPAAKRRFFLSESHFLALLARRFSDLSGSAFAFPESLKEKINVLPYYWDFSDPRRNHSDGHRLKGCVGSLYIKGRLEELLPCLVLGAELHTGGQFSYSYGYYRLYHARSFFSAAFRNRENFFSFSNMLMAESDNRFQKKEADTSDGNDMPPRVWNALERDTFTFSPTVAFHINKPGSPEKRRIETIVDEDYLVQRFLLRIIHSPMDKIFEESSMGYRRNKSVQEVEKRVWALLEEGYHYILESDIEDFFPSIDHEHLEILLKQYFPQKDHFMVSIILSAVRVPFVLNGRLVTRTKGLAQGSPLSPLLTNLYLDSFDEHFIGGESVLIRYSDDFVILCKTREDVEKAAVKTKMALEELSLRVKAKKTRIIHFSEGFYFLGTYFSQAGPGNRTSPDASAALKKTLYITEPFSFLCLEGESLEIRKGAGIIQSVPLHRVGAIITLERVSFSSGLIRKCTDLGIPTTLTMNSGYYVTTIKPDSKKYYDTLAAHSARFGALSEGEKLAVAAEIAAMKIRNYRAFFKCRKKSAGKNAPEELNSLIMLCAQAENRILSSSTIDEIRGTEGYCARKTFSLYKHFFNQPAFFFTVRDRKRRDPANAIFNFGYYLLFTRLNTLIRVQGLNPYLGFLHSEADRYESFTCDMQEMFRSRIDQFLCTVINLKVLTEKDFQPRAKGLFLSREKKKVFLELFERNLVEKRSKNKLSLLEAMEWQVGNVRAWVLDGTPLKFYSWDMT